MAVLCYAQPLNNGICTAYEYFFFRLPFPATPLQILTVNKRIFIYIHKNLFAPQAPDLLEKLAESILSSQTIFAKIENKKDIAKN